MEKIYLDHAATTPLDKEIFEKITPYFTGDFGNADSPHALGRKAMNAVDFARDKIAELIGAKPNEVYFTSGGTESDNWAIIGGAEYMMRKGKRVITSAVEHDAVRKSMEELERRGFEVTYLKPEKSGNISVEAVENALRADTILVSLMLVNNETGAITDISAISAMDAPLTSSLKSGTVTTIPL